MNYHRPFQFSIILSRDDVAKIRDRVESELNGDPDVSDEQVLAEFISLRVSTSFGNENYYIPARVVPLPPRQTSPAPKSDDPYQRSAMFLLVLVWLFSGLRVFAVGTLAEPIIALFAVVFCAIWVILSVAGWRHVRRTDKAKGVIDDQT